MKMRFGGDAALVKSPITFPQDAKQAEGSSRRMNVVFFLNVPSQSKPTTLATTMSQKEDNAISYHRSCSPPTLPVRNISTISFIVGLFSGFNAQQRNRTCRRILGVWSGMSRTFGAVSMIRCVRWNLETSANGWFPVTSSQTAIPTTIKSMRLGCSHHREQTYLPNIQTSDSGRYFGASSARISGAHRLNAMKLRSPCR